ncbi:MAG: hypothetical protein ACN23H_01905 [Candidatus Phytoplasma vitis]|nr:MAG: hypothetical protein M6G77_00365 [Candidatus Phytoplasma vitis]
MRILPYELYPYSSDLSLCALRKEFGMYDYCLNNKKNNKSMELFLKKGRNYFNLSIYRWIQEMKKRKHYVNSFHLFYAFNNKYQIIETDLFLILECCIQWEIKSFAPYNTNLTWYQIFIKIAKLRTVNIKQLDLALYNQLFQWYKVNFMRLNKQGSLKPYQLDMVKVIKYFSKLLNF